MAAIMKKAVELANWRPAERAVSQITPETVEDRKPMSPPLPFPGLYYDSSACIVPLKVRTVPSPVKRMLPFEGNVALS